MTDKEIRAEIFRRADKMKKQKQKRLLAILGSTAVCLCIVLCLAVFYNPSSGNPDVLLPTGSREPGKTASVVSIDVNPSLLLSFDKDERITGFSACNEDGKHILSKVEVKGKPLGDAAKDILGALVKEKYLRKEGNDLLVSARDGGNEAAKRVAKAFQKSAVQLGVSCQVLTAPPTAEKQVLTLAQQLGITEGKAKLIETIYAFTKQIPLKELATLSISDLCFFAAYEGADLSDFALPDEAGQEAPSGGENPGEAPVPSGTGTNDTVPQDLPDETGGFSPVPDGYRTEEEAERIAKEAAPEGAAPAVLSVSMAAYRGELAYEVLLKQDGDSDFYYRCLVSAREGTVLLFEEKEPEAPAKAGEGDVSQNKQPLTTRAAATSEAPVPTVPFRFESFHVPIHMTVDKTVSDEYLVTDAQSNTKIWYTDAAHCVVKCREYDTPDGRMLCYRTALSDGGYSLYYLNEKLQMDSYYAYDASGMLTVGYGSTVTDYLLLEDERVLSHQNCADLLSDISVTLVDEKSKALGICSGDFYTVNYYASVKALKAAAASGSDGFPLCTGYTASFSYDGSDKLLRKP